MFSLCQPNPTHVSQLGYTCMFVFFIHMLHFQKRGNRFAILTLRTAPVMLSERMHNPVYFNSLNKVGWFMFTRPLGSTRNDNRH